MGNGKNLSIRWGQILLLIQSSDFSSHMVSRPTSPLCQDDHGVILFFSPTSMSSMLQHRNVHLVQGMPTDYSRIFIMFTLIK
jgi:hypothetical protein